MNDVVISIENLSKRYRLGEVGTGTLSHDLNRWWASIRGKEDPNLKIGVDNNTLTNKSSDQILALRNVNLEIERGEILGIIGKNGAGKSTLLKLISRITSPTSGRIRVKGRIASLLEVGTGMHPEMTARENIYLNGAILGMKTNEINKKFDEIVDFSGCEKFVDTPIKRYSTGMKVRLGFAVAANLEADILIVDEVLAVGDAAFQKKCTGKIERIGKDGRTVLFVSHNMAVISNLCKKGIVFEDGAILFNGAISEAVVKYYESSIEKVTAKNQFESEQAMLLGSELVGVGNTLSITIHDNLTVRMKYRIKRTSSGISVPNFHFFSSDGTCAFVSSADGVKSMSVGEYVAECKIPGNLLNEGIYFVGVALTTFLEGGSISVDFFDHNALTFNVIDPMDELSNRYGYGGPFPGIIRPKLQWNIYKD
jgi:homopolymeric O-antigen transport system ATP-binding protein